MALSRRKLTAPVALAALSAAGAVAAAAKYRSEMQRKRLALQGGGRTMTHEGVTVEYAERGNGPAVLSIHGAGGGWDQGLLITRIIGGPYRWIAPSRFGYLRSTLPVAAGVVAQARAYAALLDHVGVSAAAVVAMSAGACSAIEFARLFPEKCKALVLLSGVSGPFTVPRLNIPYLQTMLSRSDPVMWAMVRLGKPSIAAFIGATPKARAAASAEELAILDELIESLLPVSARAAGIINDLRALPNFTVVAPAQLRVPTLLVHARDDRLVPVAVARAASAQLPCARLLEYLSGGHLLLGHHREVSREVRRFLDSHITEEQALSALAAPGGAEVRAGRKTRGSKRGTRRTKWRG